jgi:hypothetical protein
MPWWNKDDPNLPEALKGKTEEEITALLGESATLRTQVASLEARQTGFETFGGQIEELKNKVNELTQPKSLQEDPNNRRELSSFLTDPDRAFAERAAPLVGLLLNATAQMAKQQALAAAHSRQRTQKNNIDGMLFEKFETEILELAKGCSAEQLAHAATWQHLFYNVKGRHADDIALQNRDRKGEFFVEDSSRPAGADGAKDDTLTEQKKKLAGKMGVTAENYLKRKKEMVLGAPENI